MNTQTLTQTEAQKFTIEDVSIWLEAEGLKAYMTDIHKVGRYLVIVDHDDSLFKTAFETAEIICRALDDECHVVAQRTVGSQTGHRRHIVAILPTFPLE